MAAPIILWHLEVSHYSEKVRWALEYKSLEHERRAPPPGVHIVQALWLTGGRAVTLPVLELDGTRIAGSAAIIEALERRFPHPPLLPDEPAHRARARELQAFFDEQLGPFTRRLAFYELGRDPERLKQVAARAAPAIASRLGPVLVPYTRVLTGARYGAADARLAEEARARILEAFDRLEQELDGGEYLVADRFTVADLAAASLLYPLVLPPQAPRAMTEPPEPYERFRASLRERRAYGWTQEMFARHRHARSTAPHAGESADPAGAVSSS